MKTIKYIHRSIFAGAAILLLSAPAKGLRPVIGNNSDVFYIQESGAGVPIGRLNVPPGVMAGRCITKVSPNYPLTPGDATTAPTASTVIVRAVIWKSGNVSPMRVVSGQPALESEAMNAVRLWRYKPFARDGETLDVTTDIKVDFDPIKPGGLITHPHQ
jgi:TonB family protein